MMNFLRHVQDVLLFDAVQAMHSPNQQPTAMYRQLMTGSACILVGTILVAAHLLHLIA